MVIWMALGEDEHDFELGMCLLMLTLWPAVVLFALAIKAAMPPANQIRAARRKDRP